MTRSLSRDAQRPAAAAVRTETAPPTILIADDSALNRRMLGAIIHAEGRVLEAHDGQQALELARAERPDLLLLDIVMPGLDGYEVCREMKADERLADIPVIIVSALTQSVDKVRGLELGAVDYVTKPFDRGEVLARVRNQLQIRRLMNSLMDANRDLKSKQRTIDEDLRAAAEIQGSLIPSSLPDLHELEIGWRFEPCLGIGGDIFNIVRLDRQHVGIYMVDVSGRGIPAAMVALSVTQSLAPAGGLLLDDGWIRAPSDVVRLLDERYPIDRFDRYFTICYMVLNTTTGQVNYCNAAHPPPRLVRPDGRHESFEAGGTVIGLGGTMPFLEGESRLDPGDRLFLFTDGVEHMADADGDRFGAERMRELLERPSTGNIQKDCDRLLAAANAWSRNRPPVDDVTVLAVEFRGPWPGDL